MPARLQRLLAIFTGALFACWPALYNRYPLLYPDSISYIGDGHKIAAAIFLHRLANFSASRSEIYSLGIYPFHWNLTPWPIVALHALLTSYIVWLVTRSILPRHTIRYFLGIITLLSALTTISWYVSLVMPDLLGALLYLSIYLLIFARDTLSDNEIWLLSLIAWFAVTAHSTHLVLAGGLCLLLVLLYLFRWKPIAYRGRSLAQALGVVAVGAASLLALHAYLYGKPSLNGNRPPYLMARIIADGPGALYLRTHCATLDWAICKSVDRLPDNDDDFLWGTGGVWDTDRATQQRLLKEEMPLVLATLRTYPREQATVSLTNFYNQLTDFGVNDFDNNDWMDHALAFEMPASHASFLLSHQASSTVPTQLFTDLQRWVVIVCCLALALLLPLVWKRQPRLRALAVVLIPTLLANAFLTAVLSETDSRYQARVVWLIPFLALLCLLDQLTHAREASLMRNPYDRVADTPSPRS
jgi:hypothetical protein